MQRPIHYLIMAESSEKKSKKKPRKTHSGPIRDKSRTKSNLVEAVGKVIQKKGYTALNGPNIAKEAGVDKKLIWTYFGSIDNLVETYLQQKDFWRIAEKEVTEQLRESSRNINEMDIYTLFENQLNSLLNDELLRKIIHWELAGEHKTLRKIADQREDFAQKTFKSIAPKFLNSDRDIMANLALQIGGLYYLALHAKANGSTFCGIDINEKSGEERILNALKDILDYTFRKEENRQ